MAEVASGLGRALDLALAAGVPSGRVILDPGLGFGKTAEQNLVVLRRLQELRSLGQPLLVGPSRKSFLGRLFGLEGEARRDGTAAAVAAAVLRGADIVRVHDVAEMVRVVRVAEALR
jgi:dihydropteroate synthase